MFSFKASFVGFALLVPFSLSFADDEITQTLHNNTYQQSAGTTCVVYQGACGVIMPATEHITTAVSAVSCTIDVDSSARITGAYLTDSGYGPGQFYVQPYYVSSNAGHDEYQIGMLTNLYFSKGQHPVVQIFVLGGFVHYFYCTISGYHS